MYASCPGAEFLNILLLLLLHSHFARIVILPFLNVWWRYATLLVNEKTYYYIMVVWMMWTGSGWKID
jgi:hypothetical protein